MTDLLVQGVQCVLAMVSAGRLSMLTHQEEAIRLLSCRKQIRYRYCKLLRAERHIAFRF